MCRMCHVLQDGQLMCRLMCHVLQDGRLMFPPLAAGGLGSPSALAKWLQQLAKAYHSPAGLTLTQQA